MITRLYAIYGHYTGGDTVQLFYNTQEKAAAALRDTDRILDSDKIDVIDVEHFQPLNYFDGCSYTQLIWDIRSPFVFIRL